MPISETIVLGRLADVMSGDQINSFVTQLQELLDTDLTEAELGRALVPLLQGFGIVMDGAETEHVQNDWYGSWFPQQPFVSLFIRACLLAGERALASDPQLAVAFYWMKSPDDGVQFAVAHSSVQVTVMMFTPEPPTDRNRAAVVLDSFEPISIVATQGGIVAVEQVRRLALAIEPEAKLPPAVAAKSPRTRKKKR
jgi:hypothetical protein